MTEPDGNGISARLWRLPGQLLLALINATAILVIDATGLPSRTNALRNTNLGVNSGMTARHGRSTYRVATFDALRVASRHPR
jgi:hypothetical protein